MRKQPARILVVDDDKAIARLFTKILTQAGFEVETALEFFSALHRLERTHMDLVLSDIQMGKKSGLDLQAEIHKRDPNLPVILITGYPNLEVSQQAVRQGAFDLLTKPIERNELLKAVDRGITHHDLLDEKTRIDAHLKAVFHTVDIGILTVDHSFMITQANRTCRDIFRHKEALKGKTVSELLSGQCRDIVRQLLSSAFTENRAIKQEKIRYTAQDGRSRVLSFTASPLALDQHHFPEAVLAIRDETRLDRLETRLKDHTRFHKLIGQSAGMNQIYALIKKLATVDSTVLITGESGTGKELVAHAIHAQSNRRDQAYVAFNCASVPDSLLESELFGHVKGAFTGAVRDHTGRFQKADGGTLFLDEIGDISASFQATLLRILQERKFEPVGSDTSCSVDLRIITATNRDLASMAADGQFRQDLYYRLNVVHIHIPPLRKRQEDIPILTEHFLKQLAEKFQKPITGISNSVLRLFMAHTWPGNVRQLLHALEYGFVVCDKPFLDLDDLPKELLHKAPVVASSTSMPTSYSVPNKLLFNEEQRIREALEQCQWNKGQAAELLDMSRTTLWRKMKRYQLSPS
ncbi:MAG: sigma-54-dependent Fis family transcriptional regulator [Magnetococcales bacterium]|nr:sigma-54-dependent Fis family transcriptional regulator [Magnetococcales bacterium]